MRDVGTYREQKDKRIVLGEGPDSPTDPEGTPLGRRWPTPIGVLLVAALAGSLILSVSLWFKLDRTRDELADAEAARAQARAPAQPQEKAPAPPAEATLPPPETPPRPAETPKPQPAAAAPAEERLLLLVTVGTRHYAEKQMRELKQKCRAPLAVYQQKRGRCAWSTCFAVAVAEAEVEKAKGCGETKGQALRDRKDFVPVPPSTR